MNASSHISIAEFPKAIFATSQRHRFERAIQREVFNTHFRGSRCPRPTLARLLWYPHVASGLLYEAILPKADLRFLCANPGFGFRVLEDRYGHHAPQLEAELLRFPSAAESILRYRRKHAGGPTQMDSAIIECMSDDPNRVLRNLVPNDAETADLLHSQAEERKMESPAWAYFWLNSQGQTGDAALYEVIARDEEYAYLAAATLRARGVASEVYQGLVGGMKTARWIFHVLRDGLAGDHEKALESVLTKCPPWAVEYWEERGLKNDKLGNKYLETVRRSFEHPCIEELHQWFIEKSARSLAA